MMLAQQVQDEIVLVDVQFLAMLSGVLVPLLTALVTTRWAASRTKAFVNAALASLAGYLSFAIEANGAIEWKPAVVGVLTAAVSAFAAYPSLWKSSGIAPKIQASTARFGIGSRPPKAHAEAA